LTASEEKDVSPSVIEAVILPASEEKDVCHGKQDEAAIGAAISPEDKFRNRKSNKGFGNYAFEDYPSSPITDIEVDTHKPGDSCPCCHKGKLYPSEDRLLLEFKGSPPINVDRYRKKTLRCGSCGYTAMKSTKIDKWSNSARSSAIIQKIMGMPFNRLETLQTMCGVPIAQSTLWMLNREFWERVGEKLYEQILQQLKDKSYTFYVDDTGMKILEVIKENKPLPKPHKVCHTTNICAQTTEGNNIVLYLTSNRYCGEHLTPIIAGRKNKDHYMRIMADACSQNNLKLKDQDLSKIINATCMAHGLTKIRDHEESYPKECAYLLGEIREIYNIDRKYRDSKSRVRFKKHKHLSRVHVKNIYAKIDELFRDKVVEPNSEFGKVLNYWIRNKEGLTMFLRIKGIDLDNNKSERALKNIIVQRKNSLFFKTKNSAAILSGLTSIVKTCEANGINAYAYLNWAGENSLAIEKGTLLGLPWDYRSYVEADTELIAA
jgi:hypothetical protein